MRDSSDPALSSELTPFYCHQNHYGIDESLRFFSKEENGAYQSPFSKT